MYILRRTNQRLGLSSREAEARGREPTAGPKDATARA